MRGLRAFPLAADMILTYACSWYFVYVRARFGGVVRVLPRDLVMTRQIRASRGRQHKRLFLGLRCFYGLVANVETTVTQNAHRGYFCTRRTRWLRFEHARH